VHLLVVISADLFGSGGFFSSTFPSVHVIFLPDYGQYVWPKHVVENKERTCGVSLLCLCGL